MLEIVEDTETPVTSLISLVFNKTLFEGSGVIKFILPIVPASYTNLFQLLISWYARSPVWERMKVSEDCVSIATSPIAALLNPVNSPVELTLKVSVTDTYGIKEEFI